MLSNVFSAYVYNDEYSVYNCIADLFYIKKGYCNHLWFMCTLFILYMIYPLLSIITKDKNTLIVSGIIVSCLSLMGVSSIFSIINPLKGWHSYALAYALCAYIVMKIDLKHIIIPFSLFMLSMGGAMIYNDFIFGENVPYTDVIFMGYKSPFIFIGTLSLIKLLSMLNLYNLNFLTFISKNSLGIYLVHIFMTKLLQIQHLSSWTRFLLPLIILVISCIICYILNKNKYTKMLISL